MEETNRPINGPNNHISSSATNFNINILSSSNETDQPLHSSFQLRIQPSRVIGVSFNHQTLPNIMRRNIHNLSDRVAERQRQYYRQYYLRRNQLNSPSTSNSSTSTSVETALPTNLNVSRNILEVRNPSMSQRLSSQFEETVTTSSNNLNQNTNESNEQILNDQLSLNTVDSSLDRRHLMRSLIERIQDRAQQMNRDGHWINFPTGLTKQEINRHTISYEYKPKKRKRMKVNERSSGECSRQNQLSESDVCSICLDSFRVSITVRRLPCLHVFHIKCIDKWLKQNKKCPICRISIAIDYDKMFSLLNSGISIEQCLNQQETSIGTNIASILQEFTDLRQLIYELPASNVMTRISLFGQNSPNNNNNNQQQQQTTPLIIHNEDVNININNSNNNNINDNNNSNRNV